MVKCNAYKPMKTRQLVRKYAKKYTFRTHEDFREFVRWWDMKNRTVILFPDENRVEWFGKLSLDR